MLGQESYGILSGLQYIENWINLFCRRSMNYFRIWFYNYNPPFINIKKVTVSLTKMYTNCLHQVFFTPRERDHFSFRTTLTGPLREMVVFIYMYLRDSNVFYRRKAILMGPLCNRTSSLHDQYVMTQSPYTRESKSLYCTMYGGWCYISYIGWNIMFNCSQLWPFRRRIGVAISLPMAMIYDLKNAVKIKISCG